jgi:Trk K+ transport system NAD-binding subunit
MAATEHVVLCGLNELGLGVLVELSRLGDEVVVVAGTEDPELRRRAAEHGARVVTGNLRHEATLHEAGVATAAALVCVEDDDVGNVHAALIAHELNPGLRIRLQMFNPELGAHVQRLFADCRVFDAAALVAPAFVSAALHEDWEERIEVAGRTLVVRQGAVGDSGVLLALARLRRDGTGELFPAEGQDALCLADADGASSHAKVPGGLTRLRRRRSGMARLARALSGVDPRLRWALLAVLALVVVSVAVFGRFDHLDLVDAIYFTVTVLTTTGFGDIGLRDAPELLELYGVLVMLLGAAAVTITFALITDAIVRTRLAGMTGALPPDLEDHVVVCGIGNIGFRVVQELARLDVPVVAAEVREDNRFLPAVRRLGVPVVIADIRLPDTAKALRLHTARCLTVLTSQDVVNLEAALNAHALRPELRVVLRLFDPDLAARVERAFGVQTSRSPVALAAPAFAAAAEGEGVIATIAVGVPALIVTRAAVSGAGGLEGMTVGELEGDRAVRVLLVGDAERRRWRPPPDTLLAAGQEVVLVLTRQELATLLERDPAGPVTRR